MGDSVSDDGRPLLSSTVWEPYWHAAAGREGGAAKNQAPTKLLHNTRHAVQKVQFKRGLSDASDSESPDRKLGKK